MTLTEITNNKTEYGTPVWKIKSEKNEGQSHPCLWMQAGAVKKKHCNNFHDCSNCKYNAALEGLVDAGKQISWQDAIRLRKGSRLPCRHSLTERFANKLCSFNYQCFQCPFDQLFEDYLTPRSTQVPHEANKVKGFDVPEGHYFHQGHTWARIESGGTIKVGFDDFSLKVLGEADALDLPLMGNELTAGKPGWGLKRQDHSAEVLSPINGVIMEVNKNVRKKPALAASAPYTEGWLFSVHTNNIKDALNSLMVDTDSMSWISDEVSVLENMIEEVTGPLSVDGGYLRADVFGNLPSLGWKNLTRRFLRS